MTDEFQPPISCYIRTLNEEAKIAATVAAALRVSREVVVIDSGSTDATVMLAKQAGARVIEQSWLGSGHQKRVGEDSCRHDWLLDLDADEVVTDELAQEIEDLFAAGEPDADVCLVPLVFVDPSGKVWQGTGTPRRAKLYDRRKIRIPALGAWDQFEIPADLPVRRLRGHILHHAFDDIAHLSSKQANHEFRRLQFIDQQSGSSVALRVYFGLPFFFVKNYLLRGRWRAGAYGFMFCIATAYNHWLRYAMLYEKNLKKSYRMNWKNNTDDTLHQRPKNLVQGK